MKRNRKRREERLRRDFLPEALELIEKPASPWGHFGIILISLTVACLLLWAIIGKIDTTVSARGRLSAGGEMGIQKLQAENNGQIKKIHVREGDHVEQGQILIELASDTEEDVRHFNEERSMENRYMETLVKRLQKGKKLGKLEKFEGKRLVEVYEYVASVEKRYQEKIEGIQLEIDRGKEEIQNICDTLEALAGQEKDYRELWQSGALPKSEWEAKKNEWSQQRQQKKIAEKELARLKKSVSAAKSEYEGELSTMRLECRKEIEEDQVNEGKSVRDYEDQFLRAPVTGTVKALLVHTEGGVVSAAQELLEIVPDGQDYIMELSVQNQDIGYIKIGQPVSIHFDTYDYQKYGKLQGEVSYISPDAFENEQLGAVYMVRVTLPEEQRKGAYQDIEWHGGIQGTAEIKTGERRIINFFIEPVREHVDGSLNTP